MIESENKNLHKLFGVSFFFLFYLALKPIKTCFTKAWIRFFEWFNLEIVCTYN